MACADVAAVDPRAVPRRSRRADLQQVDLITHGAPFDRGGGDGSGGSPREAGRRRHRRRRDPSLGLTDDRSRPPPPSRRGRRGDRRPRPTALPAPRRRRPCRRRGPAPCPRRRRRRNGCTSTAIRNVSDVHTGLGTPAQRVDGERGRPASPDGGGQVARLDPEVARERPRPAAVVVEGRRRPHHEAPPVAVHRSARREGRGDGGLHRCEVGARTPRGLERLRTRGDRGPGRLEGEDPSREHGQSGVRGGRQPGRLDTDDRRIARRGIVEGRGTADIAISPRP